MPGAGGEDGALNIETDGSIKATGNEALCVALSLPKAEMPAGGWPVVIYAHGTGGNYMSGVAGGVAKDLAEQGTAMLSFDGVMHGPRQGLPRGAWRDPGRLFFNAANPRAARDNVLQGAADAHNLVYLLETWEPEAGVRFNPTQIMYYGHSQGTVGAMPFVPHEPSLRAAVFTGAGAEIGLTLVHKKKPNDVGSLTRALFGDQSVSRLHPMIGLMSALFAPSDATPYARGLSGPGVTADLLHVVGFADGFTPNVTQDALIRAGGYPLVGDVLQSVKEVDEIANGAQGNFSSATVGALQFAPSVVDGAPAYDGHFVGTRNDQARLAILKFFETAITGGGPARIEK
jgi:dienelactone hydrolase